MSDNHDPVVTEGATPEAAEVNAEESAGGCPVLHGRTHPVQGDANQEWWPNKLNLKILAKNPAEANPLDGGEVEGVEALGVVEPLAHRVGLGRVLGQDLQVELVRPPLLVGIALDRVGAAVQDRAAARGLRRVHLGGRPGGVADPAVAGLQQETGAATEGFGFE